MGGRWGAKSPPPISTDTVLAPAGLWPVVSGGAFDAGRQPTRSSKQAAGKATSWGARTRSWARLRLLTGGSKAGAVRGVVLCPVLAQLHAYWRLLRRLRRKGGPALGSAPLPSAGGVIQSVRAKRPRCGSHVCPLRRCEWRKPQRISSRTGSAARRDWGWGCGEEQRRTPALTLLRCRADLLGAC